MPTISVLMSVYNGETFVKEAIDSVLNQTFKDFEFIIFDDCSTDNSAQIIENYQDERIIFIKNQQNRGLTVNLHEGMNLAKGKYVARMDADDICMPNRFQKQFDFLESHPEISILGSAVVFFDDTGKEILGTQPLTHDEIIIELLLGFTMLHPSVIMRLEDMRHHDLNYDTHFRYSQDFDLWVRASRLLKFANLQEPLLKMREHQLKISRALKPAQKAFSNEIRERQFSHFPNKLQATEKLTLHNFSSGIILNTKEELKTLENSLHKIIESNALIEYFNQRLLKTRINHLVFIQYYSNLVQRNKSGLLIWKSSFKLIRSMSLKNLLKTTYRSALTIIQFQYKK